MTSHMSTTTKLIFIFGGEITNEDDMTAQPIDALDPLPSASSQFEATISLVRTAKLQSTAAWRTRQLGIICAQWKKVPPFPSPVPQGKIWGFSIEVEDLGYFGFTRVQLAVSGLVYQAEVRKIAADKAFPPEGQQTAKPELSLKLYCLDGRRTNLT
ncbi:hypothetical protein PEBR_22875 [Penicillium brasilianum]|uniref:Uncharacterized protein n=1 Tax=Penicillium brasilianum TaxID=104259 RepID=A0A1S9RMR2_PENBI|nr:hypothetical protein PEBR_22875 [Penicillium brasilianum]